MEMRTGHRIAWIVGLAATVAATVGGLIYFGEKNANAAPPPAPNNNFLAIITDPATVKQSQAIVAKAIYDGNGALIVGPGQPVPTVSDYNAYTGVNGDPTDPKWMAILQKFQWYVNTGSPLSGPPGFPTTLRDDGVLDYATALELSNS